MTNPTPLGIPIDTLAAEPPPVDPSRVKAFAKFFKNYMSISAVVAAALPIPVTSCKLIPTFAAQTSILSVYTSLFCFLMLGFIFYSRHVLARAMFTRAAGRSGFDWRTLAIGLAPAGLIGLSLFCVFSYHSQLTSTVSRMMMSLGSLTEAPTFDQVIEKTPLVWIIDQQTLMGWYLGIFVFAEAAFILMALREYIQDVLRISDVELIRRPANVGVQELIVSGPVDTVSPSENTKRGRNDAA